MNLILEFVNGAGITLIIVVLSILAVLLLAYYVLYSISLLSISKKLNKKDRWMCFVPYLNYYYMGYITDNVWGGLLILLLSCVTSLSKWIWLDIVFYVLFSIVYSVLIKKIYNYYYKNNETLTILTGVSFTLLGPIVLFINRNKKIKR